MEKEEQLIALVSEKSFLFDRKHAYYKDTDRKQNAFSEIAKAINLSGAKEARDMWEKIRKEYTGYLRKLKMPSGSGSSNPPHFRHAGSMSFYQSFYKPYKSFSNVSGEDAEEVDDENGDDQGLQTDGVSQANVVYEGFNGTDEVPEVVIHNQNQFQETPSVPKSRNGRKTPRDDQEFNERFFQVLEKTTEMNGDEYDHFGGNIAARLRKLSAKKPRYAIKAQLEMQRQLVEFELQACSEDEVESEKN